VCSCAIAVGSTKLAQQGGVVTYTITIINGDVAVPAGNFSFVVNSTDPAYAAAPVTCSPAVGAAIPAASAIVCSFPITVTAAHITATQLPPFVATITSVASAGGYTLTHNGPAVNLYTTASLTTAAPVIISNDTTFINGTCEAVCKRLSAANMTEALA
jgi:hypothetical protein